MAEIRLKHSPRKSKKCFFVLPFRKDDWGAVARKLMPHVNFRIYHEMPCFFFVFDKPTLRVASQEKRPLHVDFRTSPRSPCILFHQSLMKSCWNIFLVFVLLKKPQKVGTYISTGDKNYFDPTVWG